MEDKIDPEKIFITGYAKKRYLKKELEEGKFFGRKFRFTEESVSRFKIKINEILDDIEKEMR